MLNRRDFLGRSMLAGGALAGAPFINFRRFRLFAGTQNEYSRRAVDLVQNSLVIDMLGLLTLDWAKLGRWERQPGAFGKADFAKLKSSGITAFNPAVDLNSVTPDNAFSTTHEWIQNWNFFLNKYPQYLMRIDRTADFARAKSEGRIGVMLGFQNADHFRSVADIGLFYGLGQRISQLTYNASNQVGSGCTAPHDAGVTEFGTKVVVEMNRLGMAIDLSHSGDCTALEAIKLSQRPVVITHTNCRVLNPGHPRCEPDEVIRNLAARGGVMGITGIRGFVRNQEPTTIENVIDHYDHVVKLVGIEHVGIGSDNDLDGRDHGNTDYRMDISGLDHPKRVYDLTEGLIRRGYSDRNIQLILGENFRRVLNDIWTA